ncbi:MAG: EamA family transporter RarD [Actinobacteria bacterium]|nr:EamA family transporter RarD [Actinomycetota bacterium]
MSEDEHPEQRGGIIVGVTAFVVWGLLTIYWKQLQDFNAFELIGWRITASAVLMAAALSATRRWGHLAVLRYNRRLLSRVIAAALLLSVNWTSYVWAVVNGHVLETALGYFISPLGTVAIGVLVLHERLRPTQQVALSLAAAAVVVLTISNGHIPWIALLMATTWTVYGYLKKQVPLSPLESMAAESLVLVVPAAALALALAGKAGSIPNSASGLQLTYAILTGAATVIPLMLFAFAVKRVPLTIMGPMNYVVPSMNFVIGWLLYDEALPPLRIVGFGLVWAGLAIFTIDSARRARHGRGSIASDGRLVPFEVHSKNERQTAK